MRGIGREALAGFDGLVVVLNADHPLTDPQSLRDLVAAHREAGAQRERDLAHPHRRDR